MLWSCSPKPDARIEEAQSDSVRAVEQNAFASYFAGQLKDTISNGAKLTFETLSKSSYDSLWRGEINFEIPVDDPGSAVQPLGDCFAVKYRNGLEDLFCETDGYLIKGAWKGLLLVNDFLVSLSDGTRYELNGTHLLSPDEKRLILYTDANQNTLTNDLFVNRIRPAAIETIIHYDFSDAIVTDAAWIADNQCLLLVAQLQDDEKDPIILAYYLMTID